MHETVSDKKRTVIFNYCVCLINFLPLKEIHRVNQCRTLTLAHEDRIDTEQLNGKHLPDVQPTGCESLNIPGDDVNFMVCVLTATTKCYLIAHVYPTSNLRKLDAKSS